MASSNRHWPSMFRSKPHHHQWQHDISSPLLPSGCHRSSPPFTSEERSPEPKPRWNPKPEQIRILEAIFNSGMVNPPREEIKKIKAQLQEYGQVGDANVFYWFQNRKSRSKHKLRHLHNSKQTTPPPSTATNSSASSSSSSSSSSPKGSKINTNTSRKNNPNTDANTNSNNSLSLCSSVITGGDHGGSGCPTSGIFPTGHNEFLREPAFLFPVSTQPGFGFSDHELTSGVQVSHEELQKHQQQEQLPLVVGPCTSLFLGEIMNVDYASHSDAKVDEEVIRMKMLQPQQQLGYHTSTSTAHCNVVPSPASSSPVTVPSLVNHLQGVGEVDGPERSTVFINEVAIEVAPGPFNVREAFGEDAVLINSSGQPLLTNEWGVTLLSLQHGASYYLI